MPSIPCSSPQCWKVSTPRSTRRLSQAYAAGTNPVDRSHPIPIVLSARPFKANPALQHSQPKTLARQPTAGRKVQVQVCRPAPGISWTNPTSILGLSQGKFLPSFGCGDPVAGNRQWERVSDHLPSPAQGKEEGRWKDRALDRNRCCRQHVHPTTLTRRKGRWNQVAAVQRVPAKQHPERGTKQLAGWQIALQAECYQIPAGHQCLAIERGEGLGSKPCRQTPIAIHTQD